MVLCNVGRHGGIRVLWCELCFGVSLMITSNLFDRVEALI